MAAMGAIGLAGCATGKDEQKEESEMPIWSGSLKAAPKRARRGPKSDRFNIIIIIADTFRADHLGCYGSARVKTPYLDGFAKQSVVFTNANAEGLPTIPCRRVYHTGKSVLPEAAWQPLAADDVTFAQVLSRHDYTTGFIVDTYHHFKPDYNFHRGFDSWQWVRGQETDRWKSGPQDKFDPKNHMPAHLWNERYD